MSIMISGMEKKEMSCSQISTISNEFSDINKSISNEISNQIYEINSYFQDPKKSEEYLYIIDSLKNFNFSNMEFLLVCVKNKIENESKDNLVELIKNSEILGNDLYKEIQEIQKNNPKINDLPLEFVDSTVIDRMNNQYPSLLTSWIVDDILSLLKYNAFRAFKINESLSFVSNFLEMNSTQITNLVHINDKDFRDKNIDNIVIFYKFKALTQNINFAFYFIKYFVDIMNIYINHKNEIEINLNIKVYQTQEPNLTFLELNKPIFQEILNILSGLSLLIDKIEVIRVSNNLLDRVCKENISVEKQDLIRDFKYKLSDLMKNKYDTGINELIKEGMAKIIKEDMAEIIKPISKTEAEYIEYHNVMNNYKNNETRRNLKLFN